MIKAISFSPKKHKATVERNAESGLPCKISKFSYHTSEDNVIWVNANSQIHEASEIKVPYSCTQDATPSVPELSTTRQLLEEIKVYQDVTVKGFILFEDRQPEAIPTKPDLTKREGCFIDTVGCIPITLWNEQIQAIKQGYYEIEHVRVRQYLGEKYLSSTTDTVFKPITENTAEIPSQMMNEAQNKLALQEIPVKDKINSVDIQTFYSCVKCNKRVPFQANSTMLR